MKTVFGREMMPFSFPLYVMHVVHERRETTLVPHGHTFAELTVVSRGSAVHRVWLSDGSSFSYKIVPGQFFLVMPGEEHTFALGEEPLVVRNILFDPALTQHLPQLLMQNVPEPGAFFSPELPSGRRYPLRPIEDPAALCRVEDTLRRLMRDAFALPQTGMSCLLMLLQLMSELSAAARQQESTRPACSVRMLQLIDYLRENYSEETSVARLAEENGFSVRSLSAQFKAATGETVVGFLQRIRIEKACFFLRCTDMRITEVALAVGFGDPAYFDRLFRRQIGVTPTRYRALTCPGG